MHIGFYEKPHWEVSYLISFRFFLEALPELVGRGATLYLESYEDREEWLPYFQKHRATPETVESVALAGSLQPTWVEHIALTDRFIAETEKFYLEWHSPMADHVHCYRDGKLLFWFHDAFTGGNMRISPEIPEEKVARFCKALAPHYERA